MPEYDERLAVPVYWWPIAAVCVLLLGAEVYAGFGWPVAVGTYAVLAGFITALFLAWGARIRVADGALHAGRARLAFSAMGDVSALTPESARKMRGDQRAYIFARPYLKYAVRVEVRDPDDPTPYWLVFTRRPQSLAKALAQARTVGAPPGRSPGD